MNETSRLTVTFQRDKDTPPVTWELTDDPPGGTHPLADAARAALTNRPDALRPVPPDAVCTMIYGGPATASVTGVWHGQAIDARFDRHNGCEIARWQAMRALIDPEHAGDPAT